MLLACVYDTSGIDTYTQLLATCLARDGHDVLVIDRSRQGLGVAAPGVEVARLPPQRGRVRVANYFDDPRKNWTSRSGRSAAFAPVPRIYG